MGKLSGVPVTPLYLKSYMDKAMDQHAFVFATRGHCIKGKQCYHIVIKNKIYVCVQNNLAYFPLMRCPLVAN